MGRLEGKVAVITGGASGIGEATVRLFSSHGAQVVIADVQDERGRRLAEELGPAVAYARTDVREERAIEAAIELAVTRWGRLDCLFNNAGAGGVTGGVESISAEGFDATMALLVRAVLLGMKHAAPDHAPPALRQHHQHGQRRRPARRLGPPRVQRGQGGGDPADAVDRDGAGGERDPGQLHLPRRDRDADLRHIAGALAGRRPSRPRAW